MNRPTSGPAPVRIWLVLLVAGALFPTGISAQTTANFDKNLHSIESPPGKAFSSSSSVKPRPKAMPVLWPADLDEAVPTVTAGVSCPLSEVLSEARHRAEDLVANLEKFTATEVIDSSEVRKNGRSKETVRQSFNYTAAVSRQIGGFPQVEESRDEIRGIRTEPVSVITAGLAVGMLIFHPFYANDFKITCEGLGQWHGQPAWQLRFEQRSDRTPRFQSIYFGRGWFLPKFKGRAWLTSGDFQIAHIDFDLLETIPKIQLRTEHSDIDYGPVDFAKRNMHLWLPEKVDFYLDIGGHRFVHRHQLSKFLLFSVETNEEFRLFEPPS